MDMIYQSITLLTLLNRFFNSINNGLCKERTVLTLKHQYNFALIAYAIQSIPIPLKKVTEGDLQSFLILAVNIFDIPWISR